MKVLYLITIAVLLRSSLMSANQVSIKDKSWQIYAKKILANNVPAATVSEKQVNMMFLIDYIAYVNKLEDIRNTKMKISKSMNDLATLSNDRDLLNKNLSRSWTVIEGNMSKKVLANDIFEKLRF